MGKIVRWNNGKIVNLYLFVLKKATKRFTEIQNSLRLWGGALDTALRENEGLLQQYYPELITPVTLENIFSLRENGQEGKEVWFDGVELISK